MLNTSINFGGFYESYHSYNIDTIIERFIEYDNESNNTEKSESDYDINYKAMHNEYIKAYVLVFSDYIKEKHDINITFSNPTLWSPSEYNFKTDVIDCQISDYDYKQLKMVFTNEYEFHNYLKERTKSYEGYQSYYTYESALNDNEILSQFILDYILELSNKEYPFYMDNHEIYELEVILEKEPELV